jgi:uncharacterized membrane protein (UPF0127 family)
MIKVTLELADTPSKRAQGMMGRKNLDNDRGMIFIFPRKHAQSFWMQNTYIPLDIAFLDDKGKIFQIEQMYPMNTRMTTSCQPCKYAVEMNEGWFAKNNIDVGFQMFKDPDWVKGLKISASHISGSSFHRVAQVELENEEILMEPNELDGELTPELEQEMQPQQPQDQMDGMQEDWSMYEQPPQPNQVVDYNMNQVSKIKYAEQNNKQMDIVYWTLSGKVLPPRRIMPLEGEGYPIKSGPNGRYLVAYDTSPTIQGEGWEIEGGTPKNFMINNIISLDIVYDEGENTSEEEQTIEEPQNLWDRMRNKLF